MRRIWLSVAFAFVAAACKPKIEAPVAGLHSAAAPVYLLVGKEKRMLKVGAQLLPSDHLQASGPAVLEYFGGATKFIDGDEFDVGDAREARLMSATVPEKQLKDGKLEDLSKRTRIIAARYADVGFTPSSVQAAKEEPSNAEYLKAFFAPKGMDNFLGGKGDGDGATGPRGDLPPPPFRPKIPHIHAEDLGRGGLQIEVDKSFIAAETDDMATAILVEDKKYDLGRSVRLIFPDGARAFLLYNGHEIELRGPLDLKL